MSDMSHAQCPEVSQVLSLFVEGTLLSENAIHRRMEAQPRTLQDLLTGMVAAGQLAVATMPAGLERRFFLPGDEDTRRLARLIILY